LPDYITNTLQGQDKWVFIYIFALKIIKIRVYSSVK